MTDKNDKPTLVKDLKDGLELNKISKSFSGRPVVREVSFELKCGEALGLLGPNGSGKTTLFYTIRTNFLIIFLMLDNILYDLTSFYNVLYYCIIFNF